MSSETEPPFKKHKTESDILKSIDYCIQKVNGANLKAVLSNDMLDPLPLTKVYIGIVKNLKELSRIIKILNERIPLKELQHLKRVKKSGVVLCPVSYLEHAPSIQEFLVDVVPELSNDFDYFREIDVQAIAPKLKHQYNPLVWSCNFHPNKYLEKLASNDFFTSEELGNHVKYVKMAFEVAKWYMRTNFTGFTDIQEINATVVVDPVKDSVVAASFLNHSHPMQHSSMLAIDNVAKTQNGGAWGVVSQNSDCHLNGIDNDLLNHLRSVFQGNLFGARTYTSKKHLPSVQDFEESSHIDPTGKNSTAHKDSLEGPYLCTGYYIYSIKEPCVMCAMGLVHARAKRVFFAFDNLENGALKSKTKLQAVPSLNHHFEVFTGFL